MRNPAVDRRAVAHLLPDDERWEGARDAVLEDAEEGPVLLILPVRVNERLRNEATQAHRE